jgi:hypothetical protein
MPFVCRGWPALFMTVRDEIAKSRGEVHGAKANERHVCGRPASGEQAVSWHVELRRTEAYLKQYVEVARGEPARRRLVAAANSRL